ncbi:hypothetical protein BD289DRAFT_131087 [Coniella lustricola]|uniref:Uncharacterized protein n=1 Tax=Coniella lustricola TaxID=2025994 RepID=A0A2T3AFP0_9PEZI|nr:hypothetical protein BD289DRAFT_131087 [Coniella lustricola]
MRATTTPEPHSFFGPSPHTSSRSSSSSSSNALLLMVCSSAVAWRSQHDRGAVQDTPSNNTRSHTLGALLSVVSPHSDGLHRHRRGRRRGWGSPAHVLHGSRLGGGHESALWADVVVQDFFLPSTRCPGGSKVAGKLGHWDTGTLGHWDTGKLAGHSSVVTLVHGRAFRPRGLHPQCYGLRLQRQETKWAALHPNDGIWVCEGFCAFHVRQRWAHAFFTFFTAPLICKL